MSVAVENPEDALRAALNAPFAPNHIPRVVANAQAPAPPAEHEQDVPNTSSKAITRSAELEAEAAAARDESWKAEYDQHLSSWREESAVRREAAEKERERWEKLRKEQGHAIPEFGIHTPSPADVRDLVTGERQGGHGVEALSDILALSANQHTTQHPRTVSGSGDDPTTSSQTWEQVGSTESSYPSLSFPNTPPHAPPTYPQAFRAPNPPPPPPPIHPPSVTLSIFDSSLSRRARVLALVSSLTINLLLPFINGVMLGFGEIFARHIIKWNGWSSVASFVGLRSPSPKVEAYPSPLSGPPPRRPR